MGYTLHNFQPNEVLHASEVNEMDQQIYNNLIDTATIQETNVAVKNYVVGEYLTLNGILYKVTVAIATGGTITPGTNCSQTNVGTELTSIKDALTRSTALNVYGGGVLERCGNVRVLTYANQQWSPSGTALAASDRPHFSSQVWGTVTVGSDTSNSYRIKVSNTGVVVLQKNGSDLSVATSEVRGQVVWIV